MRLWLADIIVPTYDCFVPPFFKEEPSYHCIGDWVVNIRVYQRTIPFGMPGVVVGVSEDFVEVYFENEEKKRVGLFDVYNRRWVEKKEEERAKVEGFTYQDLDEREQILLQKELQKEKKLKLRRPERNKNKINKENKENKDNKEESEGKKQEDSSKRVNKEKEKEKKSAQENCSS